MEGDDLLAEAHAVPLPWDGSREDLPSGWDEGFVRGMTVDAPHTALMALAISVAPEQKGKRLSSRMIATFTEGARAAGLSNGVIAPVRPTWKERYPLIPIEAYVGWRREDGSHFDPWLRIHEKVGGEILEPARRKARELGEQAKEKVLDKGSEAMEKATEKVASAGEQREQPQQQQQPPMTGGSPGAPLH